MEVESLLFSSSFVCPYPTLHYLDLPSDSCSLQILVRLKKITFAEEMNKRLALGHGPPQLVQINIIILDSAERGTSLGSSMCSIL